MPAPPIRTLNESMSLCCHASPEVSPRPVSHQAKQSRQPHLPRVMPLARFDPIVSLPKPSPTPLTASLSHGLTPTTTDPLEFLTTRLDFHPDPAQTTLIQSPQNRVIVNCCRQWGKSTLTAALAVFRSVSSPESLTLILSPSERQSAEFLHKAATFLQRLGIRTRSDGHNATSLLLPNRSRIIGLPARDATIRGFSAVSLLIIDEASRLPDHVYHAIRPMLAVSSGDLWMLSTPWGKSGFFYQTWANGGPQWTRLQVPAAECPRISPTYLEEERLNLGETLFKQEYCCDFVDPIDSVFSLDDYDIALSPTVSPIYSQEQR
jgi:hypothetical protein